jgi:outer membrane protein OmpA-like peptidoglycan-associated protein
MKKIIFSFILLLAIAANAQEKNYNQWSVEAEAGVHKPASPFSPGYYTSTPSLWQGGLGVRYMMNQRYGIKLDAGYNSIKNHDDSQAFETKYFRTSLQGVVNLGNVLNFNNGTKTFGLLAHGGMGYSLNTPKSPIDYDKGDQMLNFIVGITPQIKLSDRVALTGDLSMVNHIRQSISWDGLQTTDGRGLNGKHMLVNASVGLTFYLGKNAAHADWFEGTDTDGDGIYDKDDACPDVFGLAAFNGCPDTDGDGVVDSKDDCPTVAGLTALNGCPDADSDGIADKDDACPNEKGTKANKGCPDTDGDGVVDKDDACPTVAGPADNKGCPWPDTDGDGVTDNVDKCPTVAGPASNNGCPVAPTVEVMATLNEYARTILFDTGKATFHKESIDILKAMTAIFEDYPQADFVIAGHTDSVGTDRSNQLLSERRSSAVRDYLISNSINADRLTTVGFGESKPIDTNKTAAGRHNNRRTEVLLKK